MQNSLAVFGRQGWFCLGAVVLLLFGLRFSGVIFGYVYSWFREGSRIALEIQLRHYQVQESAHFRVHYLEADANVVSFILAHAEEVYTPLNEAFAFKPKGKVPLVIYPDQAALARCFGWPADVSALGVYWLGTIRILSPNAWTDQSQEACSIGLLREQGPLAHEYTHYIIDYQTKGNYPRWFTEGVAQWAEEQWSEPMEFDIFLNFDRFCQVGQAKENPDKAKSNIAHQLYTLMEMDKGFDRLPDQKRAYWESRMVLTYLQEYYGSETVFHLLQFLHQGKSLNQSLEQALAVDLIQFDQEFRGWLAGEVTRTLQQHELDRCLNM